MMVVICDLPLEDAQRNTNAPEAAALATPVIVTRQLSHSYHPMLQILRSELWDIACDSEELNIVPSHFLSEIYLSLFKRCYCMVRLTVCGTGTRMHQVCF